MHEEVIELFGGPKHGERVTLLGARMHSYRIPKKGVVGIAGPDEEISPEPNGFGLYTRVGSSHDFEWVGWVRL